MTNIQLNPQPTSVGLLPSGIQLKPHSVLTSIFNKPVPPSLINRYNNLPLLHWYYFCNLL